MADNPTRRLGRMMIPEQVILNEEVSTEIFRQLGFVPWHVEYQPGRGAMEMLGASPLFDELEDGNPAPFYDISIQEHEVEEGIEIEVEVTRDECDL